MTTSPPAPLRDGGGGEEGRRRYSRGSGMTARARALRNGATDAERRLWSRLRRDALGVRFRRQVAVGERSVLDFDAPAARLAVEVDGGHHALQAATDARRTAWSNGQGIEVLHFWNGDVLRDVDAVATVVQDAVTARISPPSPERRGDGGEVLSARDTTDDRGTA